MLADTIQKFIETHYPNSSDYNNLGITERYGLDKQKELLDELKKVLNGETKAPEKEEHKTYESMWHDYLADLLNTKISAPSVTYPVTYKQSWDIPLACACCPNHPSNGGSGICNCTLGLTPVRC